MVCLASQDRAGLRMQSAVGQTEELFEQFEESIDVERLAQKADHSSGFLYGRSIHGREQNDIDWDMGLIERFEELAAIHRVHQPIQQHDAWPMSAYQPRECQGRICKSLDDIAFLSKERIERCHDRGIVLDDHHASSLPHGLFLIVVCAFRSHVWLHSLSTIRVPCRTHPNQYQRYGLEGNLERGSRENPYSRISVRPVTVYP